MDLDETGVPVPMWQKLQGVRQRLENATDVTSKSEIEGAIPDMVETGELMISLWAKDDIAESMFRLPTIDEQDVIIEHVQWWLDTLHRRREDTKRLD